MFAPRPQSLPQEILDSLSPDHPGAKASRWDLAKFNRFLGSAKWLKDSALANLKAGERVLELGAGDGALARAMHRSGLPWDGLDRIPAPNDWPHDCAWLQEDALEFTPHDAQGVWVANLLLHHFDPAQLSVFGHSVRRGARVLIVADLWRTRFHAALFPLACRLIRAHAVTRHDGLLSIRAGFAGDELPLALGLTQEGWTWKVTRHWNGSYRMIARRKA